MLQKKKKNKKKKKKKKKKIYLKIFKKKKKKKKKIRNCSTIFATASNNDIRIWNVLNCEELLRITVPNLHCKCITFNKDGNSLITGNFN